jgi:hypothetical protein
MDSPPLIFGHTWFLSFSGARADGLTVTDPGPAASGVILSGPSRPYYQRAIKLRLFVILSAAKNQPF